MPLSPSTDPLCNPPLRERARSCADEATHGRGKYCYAELVEKIMEEMKGAIEDALTVDRAKRKEERESSDA